MLTSRRIWSLLTRFMCSVVIERWSLILVIHSHLDTYRVWWHQEIPQLLQKSLQLQGDICMLGWTDICILKSEAFVCAMVCRYFLVPCDKRKHTGHAQQQARTQASTDSACRHPVWLTHSSLGFQHPVGHRSFNSKPHLTGEVCVMPQATVLLLPIVACNLYT